MKRQACDNRTAVLLVTDKSSSGVIQLFQNLQKASISYTDVFIAYHQKAGEVPNSIAQLDHFIFNDDILHGLGYTPIGKTLVPGNNHFPLFKFYRQHRNYENYWIIEDDVRFTGDWSSLFNSTDLINADFISCGVRGWHDEPNWGWWREMKHPTKQIQIENRIASFNPIYRISNDAVDYIDNCLLDKWVGHHEVLLPTLLRSGGYTLADFGGDGNFVPSIFTNKFYHLLRIGLTKSMLQE